MSKFEIGILTFRLFRQNSVTEGYGTRTQICAVSYCHTSSPFLGGGGSMCCMINCTVSMYVLFPRVFGVSVVGTYRVDFWLQDGWNVMARFLVFDLCWPRWNLVGIIHLILTKHILSLRQIFLKTAEKMLLQRIECLTSVDIETPSKSWT